MVIYTCVTDIDFAFDFTIYGCCRGRDLCNQCLVATDVVNSNPDNGQVYSIQHYVIIFVSDLRQFGSFLLVSSTNKTDRHDITESGVKYHKQKPTNYKLRLDFGTIPTVGHLLFFIYSFIKCLGAIHQMT